jgi:Flp pilus assembly pilin Flp
VSQFIDKPARRLREAVEPARGQTVVEYALILTFIALVVIAALSSLGVSVANWMSPINTGF